MGKNQKIGSLPEKPEHIEFRAKNFQILLFIGLTTLISMITTRLVLFLAFSKL